MASSSHPTKPPPTPKLSLAGLLTLPYRLCNPPPAAVAQNRSCGVTPIYKVKLEDVLERKHLPPLGLKDFEQYLLAVEQPEFLYFVLWLKEYDDRYHNWSLVSKRRRHQPSARGRPGSVPAYRVGNPAEISPELATFYLRAQQTFFAPGAPYELDAPPDVLAPFIPISDDNTRTAYGAHPDPEVFTELSLIAHQRLKASLDRFVLAAYPNVGSRRALCGLVGGTVIALAGFAPPITTNFVNHASRWSRFAALPGLWLGLTIIIASLHGLCVMIYIFGDLRQLRKYEFMPLPEESAPPEKRMSHLGAHPIPMPVVGKPPRAQRPSIVRKTFPPDVLGFRHSAQEDELVRNPRRESQHRPPPLRVPERAQQMSSTATLPNTPLSATPSTTPLVSAASHTPSPLQTHFPRPAAASSSSRSSKRVRIESPTPSMTFMRPVPLPQLSPPRALSPIAFSSSPPPEFSLDAPRASSRASTAHSSSSSSSEEYDEDDDEYVDEEGNPVPPPIIEVSAAFYDGIADDLDAPAPAASLPAPLGSEAGHSAATHHHHHHAADTAAPWPSASFIRPDPRPSLDGGSMPYHHLARPGPPVAVVPPPVRGSTFDFEGLPERRPGTGSSAHHHHHHPRRMVGASWPAPSPPRVDAVDLEKGLGRGGTPYVRATSAANYGDGWMAAPRALLSGLQERCSEQRRLRAMLAVPAFASPLAEVQSPVVTRAQWEILMRSAAGAFLLSLGLVGGLVAVPVPS